MEDKLQNKKENKLKKKKLETGRNWKKLDEKNYKTGRNWKKLEEKNKKPKLLVTLIKTVDFGCYSGPRLLGAVSDPAYTSELLDASDLLNNERGTLFVKAKERPL